MKAAVIVTGAGVILGWLILRYTLDRQVQMEPLWTADTVLPVFLGFALFAAFIYVTVKLTSRRY